jgi:hypothetical protein
MILQNYEKDRFDMEPMKVAAGDRPAYEKITQTFAKFGKRGKQGLAMADLVAKTGIPLEKVRELVPVCADEYNGRLEVTASGEILYSFPNGFKSRYRGFKAVAGRFFRGALKFAAKAAKFLFKIWIVVMLVGYFVLFLLLALAALCLSVVARSSSSSDSGGGGRDGGGGFFFVGNIFSMLWRIWFFSELASGYDRRYYGYYPQTQQKPKGRPLHKAVFSFVFGDGDPNASIDEREKQSIIAYIQARDGVITQGEFMALSGAEPAKAEEKMMRYCAEFGGVPEATDDGVVIYRFEELLRRVDRKDRSFRNFSAPLESLRVFSLNKKSVNIGIGVINLVNTIFGGFFLSNALEYGVITTNAQLSQAPQLYAVTYALLHNYIVSYPYMPILIGLGVVPLAFSILFYLIPGIRFLWTKKENERIKMDNLRKFGFNRIWNNPESVRPKEIQPEAEQLRPKNIGEASERVITEMGAYSMPEVEVDEGGTVYRFNRLAEEKQSVESERERYRALQGGQTGALGEVVYDSALPVPDDPDTPSLRPPPTKLASLNATKLRQD